MGSGCCPARRRRGNHTEPMQRPPMKVGSRKPSNTAGETAAAACVVWDIWRMFILAGLGALMNRLTDESVCPTLVGQAVSAANRFFHSLQGSVSPTEPRNPQDWKAPMNNALGAQGLIGLWY